VAKIDDLIAGKAQFRKRFPKSAELRLYELRLYELRLYQCRQPGKRD